MKPAVTFQNPSREELYARRWQIWAVVMIGLFMALIDVTIVNITIPQLERDLDAPVDTVSTDASRSRSSCGIVMFTIVTSISAMKSPIITTAQICHLRA